MRRRNRMGAHNKASLRHENDQYLFRIPVHIARDQENFPFRIGDKAKIVVLKDRIVLVKDDEY